jgi:hypothetical protein
MRRNWIKLYVDQCLRGSMMTELDEPERFVWFGFLLLAGDCAHEGRICATENSGYTDIQLADLLKTDADLIKRAKRKFLKFGKITIDENGIIQIVKWQLYQSEYFRQKSYRLKLQGEVTDSSPSILSSSSLDLFKEFLKTITPEDRALWKTAYPACDIDIEAAKALDWITSNPERGRKSNYRRFFTNWLKRSQDKGGTIRAAGRSRNDFEADIDRIKIGREKP